MKVYIAGPMTNIQDFNYPAFFDAEVQLTNLGHEAINPARLDSNEDVPQALAASIASIALNDELGHSWEYYIRRDIPIMMKANALCLLPGWQGSRGASLEVQLATALKIPLLILKDGKLLPRVEAIGLSGYARSGKDTVGRYLAEQGWLQVAFADSIRKSLYAFNPRVTMDMRVADIVDDHGWETGKLVSPEMRILLQRLGTQVGRELLGENVWVDLTIRNIPDGSRVVFTDCRFENEADKVREIGGKVWRVNRPNGQAINDHISEVALDDYDFDQVFINDGDISDLTDKAEKALQEDRSLL